MDMAILAQRLRGRSPMSLATGSRSSNPVILQITPHRPKASISSLCSRNGAMGIADRDGASRFSDGTAVGNLDVMDTISVAA
jgi:hypothetical protein